jgi:hypothetical protein
MSTTAKPTIPGRPWMVSLLPIVLAGVLLQNGCTIGSSTRPVEPPFSMLNAYGQWFDLPPYGRVWQPTVTYEWRPYGVGRWYWTDQGWYWDSPEPFAWVVYHYGTWTFVGASGWVWVPGYEWSPARVRWMVIDNYVGWSPLLPGGYTSPAPNPDQVWVVVPAGLFIRDDVTQYRIRSLPVTRARRAEDELHPPDVGMIEQQSGRPVVRLKTESKTVRSGTHTLSQVRITGEQVRGKSQQGQPSLSPPPALPPAGQNPQAPKGTRESGQTRTPSSGNGQRTPQTPRSPQPDTTKARTGENQQKPR